MNISDITGIKYEEKDCVFFRNYVQAAHYINWGARLIDIFTDSEYKLVFVFTKEDHNKYKNIWGNKNNNKNGD